MYQTLASSDVAPVPAEAPIRALLLDDSAFDRARIQRLSRQARLNIEVDEVDSLPALKSAADHTRYDLFLIDYRLPVGDGLTALRMLREDTRHAGSGSILITGTPALETTVDAMRCGYDDVLSKDELTPEHLRAAIQDTLSTARGKADQDRLLTRRDFEDGLARALQNPEIQARLHQAVTAHVQQQVLHLRKSADPNGLHAFLTDFLQNDEFDFPMQS